MMWLVVWLWRWNDTVFLLFSTARRYVGRLKTKSALHGEPGTEKSRYLGSHGIKGVDTVNKSDENVSYFPNEAILREAKKSSQGS